MMPPERGSFITTLKQSNFLAPKRLKKHQQGHKDGQYIFAVKTNAKNEG
jgi:hypothetical protein